MKDLWNKEYLSEFTFSPPEKCPAIYMIVEHFSNTYLRIYYIGQTTNLYRRNSSHLHLKTIQYFRPDAKLFWMKINYKPDSEDQINLNTYLRVIEKYYIKKYSPKINILYKE